MIFSTGGQEWTGGDGTSRCGGSSSPCSSLEMTKAFLEVDRGGFLFHLLLTEGPEAAKPNVFGVGLTVSAFLSTPS